MKLFLVLLSLCQILQTCYSTTCETLPPGLDRLSHGIDITSFDLLPTDFTKQNGISRTIFDFTCDKHKKWTNPFVPTLKYDLPDQIESIINLPGGILDYNIEIQNTYKDTKTSKSSKVGLGFLGGMFGLSSSSSRSMEQIVANEKILTTVSAHVSAIEVDLIPYWTETPGTYMKQFIDQFLPNTYTENPSKYQEFLSTFGTHYFTSARFGGLMSVEIETDSHYASTTNAKNLELQASLSFLEKLSLSGGHTKSNANVDINYKQNSAVKEFYYGGNANLIATGLNGFQNWWDSAQRMPWVFGGQLASILSLIPDGPKKSALNIAITVKLDYAYLDELAHSLEVLKRNPNIDVSAANKYLNEVMTLRSQVVPPHPSVEQLGVTVEQFVMVQKDRKPTPPPLPLCPNSGIFYIALCKGHPNVIINNKCRCP